MADADILHVSDTALMVAACRAMETARPDGLVRDPFAEELAGTRGMAILQGLARAEIMRFGVGIRSLFLDELVSYAVIGCGVRTVLSLGSGLDTRPWRLALPESLRWTEVDFPAMQEYKASVMDRHRANCQLSRMAADLSDTSARERILAAVGDGPSLMITEGLLMYLPAEAVEALAGWPVQYWMADIVSPRFARYVRQDSIASIQAVRAEGHLDGTQIFQVVERHGWKTVRRRSYTMDVMSAAGERVRQLAALRPENPPEAPAADDPSGVHLFGKR